MGCGCKKRKLSGHATRKIGKTSVQKSGVVSPRLIKRVKRASK